MATAELAVAMPALAILLVFALAGLGAVVDQVRCLDAARAAARALARGDTRAAAIGQAKGLAPEGAAFAVSIESGRVRVRVSSAAPAALAWVGEGARPVGSAVARLENASEAQP